MQMAHPINSHDGGSVFHAVVFDEFMLGNAVYYTSEHFNHSLGQQGKLAIHCIVNNQNNSGAITVQIQHSGDGRNWLPKYSGNGEISAPSNVAAAPSVASLVGFDQGATPSLALLRLAITLVAPCTAANVRISATGRPCNQ